jgi:hypothetical protein
MRHRFEDSALQLSRMQLAYRIASLPRNGRVYRAFLASAAPTVLPPLKSAVSAAFTAWKEATARVCRASLHAATPLDRVDALVAESSAAAALARIALASAAEMVSAALENITLLKDARGLAGNGDNGGVSVSSGSRG